MAAEFNTIFSMQSTGTVPGNQIRVASGSLIATFTNMTDLKMFGDFLTPAARALLDGNDPALAPRSPRYAALRVAGRTEAQIDADIASIMDGTVPTRVACMKMADGSVLFVGQAK